MVSVIIPVYNEEKTISDCLSSLASQNYKDFEIIIVNDGSADNSKRSVQKAKFHFGIRNLTILSQSHQGPAISRNLGAKFAKGDILVFVDADMTFDKDFINKLVKPIESGEYKGTFSKEEFLANKNNVWAVCWNINRYLINNWKLDHQIYDRILPTYYPSEQPVFRAILKKDFDSVGGFAPSGYTDDWTLANKLGFKANAAPGSVYYHNNPASLFEIYSQARWIGGNRFLTGNLLRKLFNLIRYSVPISLILGLYLSIKFKKVHFFVFKIIYDFAVFLSILTSFVVKITRK